MAINFLSASGPLELILCIHDACNSAIDGLSLTSTRCTLFHGGRDHAVARFWSELLDEIPCFQLALIAVGNNPADSVSVT